MMLATVEALRDLGGSARIDELAEKVAEIEGVTDTEQAFQMSGDDPRSRFHYYLAWSRTYLKNGGALINSSRGVWALTEEGSKIRSITQTEAIHESVAAASRKKKRTKGLRKPLESESKSDDQDELGLEIKHEGDWKNKLLLTLIEMSPAGFERLSQRILREAGFTKVEVRGQSGDGGIDGVGVLRVNLVSFQVFFQSKRWRGSVGPNVVRDFRGAMVGRADKGLIITTAKFTASAYDEATRDGATAIDLIDGDKLCDLLKELDLGVKTELIEKVSVENDFFEAFSP
jgi:restriction system protein